MNRIFLATSFSGKVDDQGAVESQFREKIESILQCLRGFENFEIFCALEDEKWSITNEPAVLGVRRDLEQLEGADVLLALVYEQPSAGVQFEIGYAIAMDKHVIIATDSSTRLAYFNKGAIENKMASHVIYTNPADLAKKVSAMIEQR